jgi:hypothetical protein
MFSLFSYFNNRGDKMESRIDEFREFVKKYPLIKEDVKNNKRTWQSFYEDWVLLGEDDGIWDIYKSSKTSSDLGNKKLDELLTTSNIKNIVEYVKKINPDSISKTLNTIQKVLQITQSFGSKPSPGLYNANYNSWWD